MQRSFPILLTVLLMAFSSLQAQPKREVRAAWLTTAYGLDWPSKRATTPREAERQKAELCRLLDELEAANLNTVLFQVRIRGDVAYPSKVEPFNEIFSGREGIPPPYDPLAFAVRECHKRGMELHAWLVTIPLGTDKHVKSLGKSSVSKQQPALCKKYQQEWYLDPGNPETKNYLMSIVREIVTGYDVDGIHFDYIRYPDHPAAFPDNDTYRKYGKGKPLAAWRRDNITAIVRHLYNGVKAVKPWVKVSSSPIGKFRDTSRYSSSGWNAYHAVYQDAQGWLQEGIQDMLFPMIYFRGNGFFPFALDWQEKCCGRFIIPGLGIYFLHPSEKNWPLEEIERQINFTRSQGLAGQAYFRAGFLSKNTKGLTDELICNYYAFPALLPAMTWLDQTPPTIPQNLKAEPVSGSTRLTWSASTDNTPGKQPYYVIYASDQYPVDVEDPRNIVAKRVMGTNYSYNPVYPEKNKSYFAVTAVDRYGNESLPAQFTGGRMENPPTHVSDTLFLPVDKRAEFIVLTDISGRSVRCIPYVPAIHIGNLIPGFYNYLLTGKDGLIIRKEGFIKR